jgi:putative PIN family toxin of toxin-antitoxin system
VHKVIIDTNIIISAVIGRGYSYRIIDELISKSRIELHLSNEILSEYWRVIRYPRFSKYTEFVDDATKVIEQIKSLASLFTPDIKLQVSKDESDNRILELAVFSKANFIITGNLKDFPPNNYQGIEIISPANYWNQYWMHEI